MRQNLLFFSVLLFSFNCVYAEDVTSLNISQLGQQIVIEYELTKAGDITAFVSVDGSDYILLKAVSGDVGKGIQPGSHRIVWDVLSQFENLNSTDVKFKVECTDNVQTFTAAGINFDMVYVKGGTFTMGCTNEQGSDCAESEKPSHRVTLNDFYICVTEVTQELWFAVMGTNPSHFKGDKNPVENVSLGDCQRFLSKLKAVTGKEFRLPTEAEWEYAARGGAKSRGYKYSGSNNIDQVAWYSVNGGAKTHPVALKQPNELGLYDMSGNVFEWCIDWFNRYSSDSQTNPKGTIFSDGRVVRGGCWGYNAKGCRVSLRNYADYDYHENFLGLRLVLEP